MAWVYLDDQFPDHPKVSLAGGEAAWLFVCGLAYTRRHELAGRIPKSQVPRLSDGRRPFELAKRLVDVGLWEDTGGHFFLVHDYDEWNRPEESRKAAARKAAAVRWEKERNAKADAEAMRSHSDSTNEGTADPHADRCPTPPPPPTVDSSPPPTSWLGHASGGGASIDAVLDEAARLIAEAEAERRGSEIGNRSGYVRSRSAAIRREREDEWRRIIEAAPSVTADSLANGAKVDSTQRAALARMEEGNRRVRGEACERCEGSGWVELEGIVEPCPACRPEHLDAAS